MDPALERLVESAEDGGREVEAVVHLDPAVEPPPGVRLVARFGERIATCRLAREAVRGTWADEAVISLKASRPFGVDPDPDPLPAREAAGETAEAWGEREGCSDVRRPPNLPETGRGVIVGVVDWGFDFAHPNFRRADGSTRALALWDQSAEGTGPAPYGYGRVWERAEIDHALKSEEPYAALGYHPASGDPGGHGAHGTHVLDIAAGNGDGEEAPTGMAPEADLLFVHLAARGTGGGANLGDSVTLLEALDWIARRAGDRPWVVNLSVGRHGGPHTGLTLVEQGIDALLAAAPGRAVVHSAGNYFASDTHVSGTLRPGQEVSFGWLTDEADVTPNELEVWYPGRDVFQVSLRPPGGERALRVRLGGEAAVVVDGRTVGRLYHRASDPALGDHHVDVFLEPGAPAGRWEVILAAEDVVDGRFHAWVERDAACPRCQSRFEAEEAVPTTTTGTIANGFHGISVGAYDACSADGDLAPFSSSGPTRDGRVKPDLVAPGVRVLAARSASRELGSDTPLLTRLSGTSMAAPHVTGTVALVFEAASRPLAIQETRRLLLGSARPAVGEEGSRVGSGYLDVEAAVAAARRLRKRETEREMSAESVAEAEAEGPAVEPAAAAGWAEALEPPPDLAPAVERSAPVAEVPRAAAPPRPLPPPASRPIPVVSDSPPAEAALPGPEPASRRAWSALPSALETFSPATSAPPPPDLGGLLARSGALGVGVEGRAASAAGLFDALTAGGALGRRLAGLVEVVAAPGAAPASTLRPGDVLVARALGEGGLGSAGVLVEEAPARAGRTLPGVYYEVVPDGAGPTLPRRVLDAAGRLPADRLVLRPRRPVAAVELAEAGPDRTPARPASRATPSCMRC